MVRIKRQAESSTATNSSSSNGSTSNGKIKKSYNMFVYWKQIFGFIVLSIAVVFGYLGYLETRVITPFDKTKMVLKSGLDVPEKYWGTYRPGTYFGLKTRNPDSLVTGLMWYFPKRMLPGGDGIRHWCEQSDHLDQYGWLQHDGRNFGIQEIIDGPFILNMSFIKRLGGNNGGDWTARISVDIKNELKKFAKYDEVSLIWYLALDEGTKGSIFLTNSASKITGFKGRTNDLGEFNIKLSNYSGKIEHESFLSTITPGLHLLKETIISSLRLSQVKPSMPRRIVLGGDLLYNTNQEIRNPNFLAIQLTAQTSFTLDVVFQSGSFKSRPNQLVGDIYTKSLISWQENFQNKFKNIFHLEEKNFSEKEIKFAQAALSNMLGGIGYFYGTSKVESVYTKKPVHYWKAPLYTAVPSRSFFPRGFLWDEGFHGFLIATWDLDLEIDIICHWFDLMNVEGWIPREQILGVEALAKVPEEFVVQHNTNANPPTFFLSLQYILKRFKLNDEQLSVLQRLYPRLQAWFSWFNSTQKGEKIGTYRWRGRDDKTMRELNPKTLTSGLDDYPRASHPTDLEYHVDLYCWIAIASNILSNLTTILNRNDIKYEQTTNYLKDNLLLNKLHWSSYASFYSDYGYHTDSVILKRPKPLPRSNQNLEMIRITFKNPEYRFVDSSFGYISLFPFLLKIIEPNEPKLKKILDDLRNPNLLWTDYGLRSISKNSPFYMKRNTEHDPPYWRGQIWININYLAVAALHHYANIDGVYKDQAKVIYNELRRNLIKNIINQYYKSGYLWEQYSDETGKGKGSRPFTGWTALIVLIMSEHY